MKDNKIKIEYVDVNDIRQYKNNPRQITQKGIDAVANSIIAFGIKQPLVIDSKNVIIVGHTRFLAIQKINNENKNAIKKVPCIRAEDLSKKEVEAYRLADNKTNEFSLWDDDLLAIELDKLDDFKMEDFGFDAPELEDLKEEAEDTGEEGINVKEGKKVICPNCGFEYEV